MRKKFLAAALMLVLLSLYLPVSAFAEGFGVYEWSAAGVAMGDNYMFAEEDPAVLAYNPAQITKLNGSYLSIGFSWFNPDTKVLFNGLGALNAGSSDSYENEYNPSVAPHIYYATKAGDNSWWGIAIFSRFGNNIEYDDLWPGRYDTIYSGIKGITVQPTYAFKINDKLSAAFGLDINYIKLRMQKSTANAYSYYSSDYDLDSDLEGDSTSLGWLVSLMYDFTPKTSAAVVYRSRVKHTMDADMDFESYLLPTFYGSTTYSTQAHGTVTLPDSLSIGIGHKFDERTRMEVNAIWTNWKTYNKLNIYIDDFLLSDSSLNPKNWDDAWRIGIGVEHKLSKKWSILCGYVYDQSPVPDYYMDFTIPTGNRHRGSIGFKYRPNDNTEIAFAYTGIWAGTRDTRSYTDGADYASSHIYDGFTQVLSLGYTVKLK